jgi:glycosyltransferase involved in cell wall biosynthesis
MKTLYLHGSPDFYGAGKVLLDILQIPGNAEKAVVVFPHEGPLCDPLRKLGVPIQIINMGVLRKKYFNPLGVISRLYFWLVAVISLRLLIKKQGIDRVYINSITIIIGPYLKINKNIRIIWHLHEIVESPSILKVFLATQLKKADQLIAVSKAAQQHWQKLLSPKEVQLLYNGIDLENEIGSNSNCGPIRKKLGDPELLLGMIGRVQERKGQSYLLRIVERMIRIDPFGEIGKFKIVIAGDAYPGNEYLITKLEQEIRQLDLSNHVSYIGYQKDIAGLLSQVDLVIVPSTLPDSFPTVVLEAMKFSLPVVATRQGGCIEMIEEGVTGYLIPLDDAAASASLLVNVMQQKERLKEVGKKGRERVAALFSITAFRSNWLKLMKR